MAIVSSFEPLEHQLWPQGDARDPLGIWGGRVSVTGDATGGSIKVTCKVPAARRSAYVYTCYSIVMAPLQLPAAVIVNSKVRLLTNFPNIDTQPGIQAYGSVFQALLSPSTGFTAPFGGQFEFHPLGPLDRFLLLYDPSPGNTDMDILELEMTSNIDTDIWAFEAYGYYWDRSVMNTPGGPRHPGAA